MCNPLCPSNCCTPNQLCSPSAAGVIQNVFLLIALKTFLLLSSNKNARLLADEKIKEKTCTLIFRFCE
jgi:hypothetical protein